METLHHKLVRLACPTLFLAVLLPACVDNNSTLFIRQVQAPDAESECVVTDDPTALHYGQGFMDASLTNTYLGWLLFGNQLHSRGDTATQKVETGMVSLYEAEVELFNFSGATLASYTMPVAGFAEEAAGTSESYGLALVVMVDDGTGAGLAGQPEQTVVSRVKLYGETLGGLEVETGWWDYPIFVCNGCLGCVCPDSIDAEYHQTCNIGNNETIDCRLHPCWPNCGCNLS